MTGEALEVGRAAGGVRFRVRVQPGAQKTCVEGVAGGALRVRVAAPPQGGRANRACVELLARALGVPASHVRLEAGAASRSKLIRVEGVLPQAVGRALSVEVRELLPGERGR
ncbi:MAG: DUF167 domain-containing protein [Acetobacteraceae bacterium]|nr:DUF167 domain-containing protein [Acetobacteraceae bacterium]